MLLHELLLFGRTGLSSRQRVFKDRGRVGCDRSPFVEFLTEEVGLEA